MDALTPAPVRPFRLYGGITAPLSPRQVSLLHVQRLPAIPSPTT